MRWSPRTLDAVRLVLFASLVIVASMPPASVPWSLVFDGLQLVAQTLRPAESAEGGVAALGQPAVPYPCSGASCNLAGTAAAQALAATYQERAVLDGPVAALLSDRASTPPDVRLTNVELGLQSAVLASLRRRNACRSHRSASRPEGRWPEPRHAYVGCMVWSATASSSPDRVSRSILLGAGR